MLNLITIDKHNPLGNEAILWHCHKDIINLCIIAKLESLLPGHLGHSARDYNIQIYVDLEEP